MVGVLPDVPAVDRILDYLVPARWAAQVTVGTVVRVPLQGRRVRGWVVAVGTEPPAGLPLREVSRISGIGPGEDLLSLAGWAAHRWAGRRLTFLRAATPHRIVSLLPAPPRGRRGWVPRPDPDVEDADRTLVEARRLAREALTPPADGGAPRVTTLRWPPGAERLPIALAAVERGPALLLTAAQADAEALARGLHQAGCWVARHPDDWAAGAAGATVVGSRAAVWSPVRELAAVVVFDEHDERYQDERAPTWHARDVAVERARRAGVPLLLVSPVPSLEALAVGERRVPSRSVERAGWPALTVVDRRELDPRQGLYPAAVVDAVRGEGRIVVVHNRIGRARLLACTRCGELCRCERCGAAMHSGGPARRGEASQGGGDAATWLRCATDPDHRAPAVCLGCGATRLAVLRPGVSRIREELEALIGEPVGELTAASPAPGSGAGPGGLDPAADARVVVGTEAALHRIRRADAVVFLDLDQGLLGARFRAAERTLGQLALAARLLGGRRRDGRLVVATRQPTHAVLEAVLHADPDRWAEPERARRALLHLPPAAALAVLEGPQAAAFAAALREAGGVDVAGPTEDRWLVKASDPDRLADALASVSRPTAGLRIVVDPAGI